MSNEQMPEDMMKRLLAVLPEQAPAVRPLPGPAARAMVIFAILVFVSFAVGFVTGGKGWYALAAGPRATLLVSLAGLLAWSSWELSLRMTPGALLRVPAAALALAAAVILTAWTLFAGPLTGTGRLFYWLCIVFTSAAVAAGMTLVWLWLKRGLPVVESMRWILAAAAACTGFAAVEFFCPYTGATHIVTSHILPAAAAAWIAARVCFHR